MSHLNASRRTFLAGSAAVGMMAAASTTSEAGAADARLSLFVGTYTTKTSKGVYPLTYDQVSDQWTLGKPDPAIENVSFGVTSYRYLQDMETKRPFYYLLDEQDKGLLNICFKQGNRWIQGETLPTEGASPCYISGSHKLRLIGVANYSSGSVVFYRFDPRSGIANAGLLSHIVYKNEGSGPNKDRQEGPHAHCVQFAPDGKHAYSVDLGTDQLLAYPMVPLNPQNLGVGKPFEAFKFPGGTGPRHLLFHPNGKTAFVVSELSNEVFSLRQGDDGKFNLIARASTLPADFTAHSQAAHLALNADGTRLYASNRGHNSIAVFAIDGEGSLKLLQISPTLGDWPRFFKLLEPQKRLIVAHQNGGTLVVFKVAEDGRLAPANVSLDVPAPVFIGDINF
ncbi:MAG: lactonase family protein [Asticcacaulis sp.]